MPLGHLMGGALPPHLIHEAARLFLAMIADLHVVAANNDGVLYALAASPQLSDAIGAFGAAFEDDEDDGTAEDDGRLSRRAVEAMLAPAPRQGHPVAAWSPSGDNLTSVELPLDPDAVVLARFWPDLVRKPPEPA